MEQEQPLINRVTQSGLVTLNLEDHYPRVGIAELDLQQLLVGGLMLREKDLREFVRNHDWSQYRDKVVAVHCSADAIIPTWAYMLVTVSLQPFARKVVFGNRADAVADAFQESLNQIDWNSYRDAKVVVKGCGDLHVPESVFVEVTSRLRAVAASIMYGEPCSTVPLFKRPKSGG
ncbi:MAG: DUF2480 family protein [Cyclobacteriaceae bacterium]|nr:DUF2480 family protein [Cyclobacteriaceae bacterium]